jgi:hypothetical protein
VRLTGFSSPLAELAGMQTAERVVLRARVPLRAQLPVRRPKLLGGADGNARLTSLAGAALLVLLAVEGATIPFLGALLSVHIFVGMLLLGPVALKLAAVGYRFARYYTRGPEYVRHGPPALPMRLVVAPVLVLSTLTLFGTGVLLIATSRRGLLLGLHKASFIVWVGAMSIHVLVYALRAGRHLLAELNFKGAGRFDGAVGGRVLRVSLLLVSLAAGVAVAIATYPLASPWLHRHWGG